MRSAAGEQRDPQYSVIIPFRDEADNASPLLAEVRDVMRELGASHEVLLIDDGSVDQTAAILGAAAAAWPEWSVLARAGDFLLIADPASAQVATLTAASRRE